MFVSPAAMIAATNEANRIREAERKRREAERLRNWNLNKTKSTSK